MKAIGIIGIIVSLFFIYVSNSALNDKTDYEKACVSLSLDLGSNSYKDCYRVYDEQYAKTNRDHLLLSIGGLVFSGILVFSGGNAHPPAHIHRKTDDEDEEY
jgi:uncharacterized membrane protein